VRARWPILAGVVTLAALSAVAIGPLGWLERNAGEGAGSSPSVPVGGAPLPVPTAVLPSDRPVASRRPLSSDEEVFADAYRTLAETHNREATDLQIANPLSEFDLVGFRLTDLVERTRKALAGLPAVDLTAGEVREVDLEMGATLVLLLGVDPHGPADDRAAMYQRALDYWVEHVQPASNAIRATLGLPASPSGDLRL
jgi:hypothetical protein